MPVRTTITSGDFAIPASASLIPMLILCCSGGIVGKTYSFDPGASVTGTLGGGIGADAVLAELRETGSTVKGVVAAPTWSPAPSVTHVGTGPAVTCALAAGSPGCYDDHRFLLTVTTGGAGGAGAAFSVCYDGATVVETVLVPAENPAAVRGTIDLTYGLDLNTLTMVWTAPAAKTLTFGAGPVAAGATGALKAATATVAAPVTITTTDLLAAAVAIVDAANGSRLVFTTAGVTPANAPATVTITGLAPDGVTAQTEVLALSQVAGSATSIKRYRASGLTLTYPAADGVAATISITYTDTYPTTQAIADAYNVLAIAAPLANRARVASTATAQYLEIYTTSAGAAVTETIDDATSTAEAVLGFSSGAGNLTATGSAAVWSPPWTGLTFTFPASAVYVAGDTYSATATGPRASLQAIVNAAVAARNDYKNNPFGFLVVAQPAADAPTCEAINAALATLTDRTWTPDPYRPIFITSVCGSPFHVASSVVATNDANIATADAALLLAFAAAANNFGSVAVDDCYIPGDASLVLGSFRRTAALPWAAKNASKAKLGADVADGEIPEITLLGPDGLTRARDASVQATHLEDNNGFSCLRSMSQGLGHVKFAPGYTRAGSTSRLRFEGPLTVALTAATIVFPIVELWEGQTDVANPFTGQLSDNAKKQRGNQLYAALKPTLLPDGGAPNVSAFPIPEILNPSAGRFVDNGEVRVRVVFYVLGEIITVFVAVSASGVVTTISAGA